MRVSLTGSDCVGLLRPAHDAHTLGLTSLAHLLGECGIRSALGDRAACSLLETPEAPASKDGLARWVRAEGVTALGLSYRLDPQAGVRMVSLLMQALKDRRLLGAQGGPLRAVYFAGLPQTCAWVRQQVPGVDATFEGDETAADTLRRLGVPPLAIPAGLSAGIRYDEDRLAFGRDLVRAGGHFASEPVDRSGYAGFGTAADTLLARLRHSQDGRLPPIMRAHAGPFLPDRGAAVRLFLEWARQLAASRQLDILSLGTSQLTQSNFGEEWGALPNGGGVPINAPEEYAAVWQEARPMLVRTYAGTKNLRALAELYEHRLHIAWHALSLWWFCRTDGRGPYTLRENLEQQLEALRYIASTGKPYEPNVSHHFAFRGADDVTCIAAAVLAARSAKKLGIRHLILQIMLNTPRATWGLQDLAKARATLALLRELEDGAFRVILQPRGGLDAFFPDPEKAKAQLAAVTALMDDIEPHDPQSPPMIHVVSYSEGSDLATPAVIGESVQITRHALAEYRQLRARGEIEDMALNADVRTRADELLAGVRSVLRAIEARVPDPYSAGGLYDALALGFLTVPYLWECRDELARAASWQTRTINGSVQVVDACGRPIPPADRVAELIEKPS